VPVFSESRLAFFILEKKAGQNADITIYFGDQLEVLLVLLEATQQQNMIVIIFVILLADNVVADGRDGAVGCWS